MRWVRNHERAPVVEDLYPSEPHVGFLHVDPVVADRLLPLRRVVVNLERIGEQTHCHEVPIDQAIRHLQHILRRRRIERTQEFPNRRGREKVVSRKSLHGARRVVSGFHRCDPPALGEDAVHGVTGANLTAHLRDPAGCFLPHLPRTELGIQKLLDQRSLGVPLSYAAAAMENLLDGVNKRLPDG